MTKKAILISIAVFMLTAAAFSASVTETFDGLTGGGTVDISGTPSLSGFTLAYNPYGGPRSSILSSTPFPGLGNTKYLETDGSVNDWVQFDGGTIACAVDPIIQFAFPIKVTSLGATAADTDADVMTLDHTSGSYTPYFNIRVSNGIFRTTDENGWPGSADPISITAFDPASSENWRDSDSGRWHLLAWRLYPNTAAGAGKFIVYDINPTTGAAAILKNYTGATNTTSQATVNRFCLGLCIGSSAVGTTATKFIIDDITFWDDAFASDDAFLSAVRAKYGTPSAVGEWNLY